MCIGHGRLQGCSSKAVKSNFKYLLKTLDHAHINDAVDVCRFNVSYVFRCAMQLAVVSVAAPVEKEVSGRVPICPKSYLTA